MDKHGPTPGAYILREGEGRSLWFAGALMTLKAGSEQTGGRFACLDQKVGPGYAVPLHVHRDEDEAWFVLAGELTFHCGAQTFAASPGAWLFLPRALPHSFKAGPSGARLLTLTIPSSFADFVQAAGEAAPALELPPEGPMDVAQLSTVASWYGIEILGPPPD